MLPSLAYPRPYIISLLFLSLLVNITTLTVSLVITTHYWSTIADKLTDSPFNMKDLYICEMVLWHLAHAIFVAGLVKGQGATIIPWLAQLSLISVGIAAFLSIPLLVYLKSVITLTPLGVLIVIYLLPFGVSGILSVGVVLWQLYQGVKWLFQNYSPTRSFIFLSSLLLNLLLLTAVTVFTVYLWPNIMVNDSRDRTILIVSFCLTVITAHVAYIGATVHSVLGLDWGRNIALRAASCLCVFSFLLFGFCFTDLNIFITPFGVVAIVYLIPFFVSVLAVLLATFWLVGRKIKDLVWPSPYQVMDAAAV